MFRLRFALLAGSALAIATTTSGAQGLRTGLPHSPENSRIIHGNQPQGRVSLDTRRGTTTGRYDPRADPRSPANDPRFDPNSRLYDPRLDRNGNDGRFDPRHDDRDRDRDREKFERKHEQFHEKAARKAEKRRNKHRSHDDDHRGRWEHQRDHDDR